MHFSSKFLIFQLSFSIVCIYIVAADEVPVVLWNIQGNSLDVKQVSALDPDDEVFAESLKEILNDNTNILVFSKNELSNEDFQSVRNPEPSNNTLENFQLVLDRQPFMFLSTVRDPISRIHMVHCGVQEIVVEDGFDNNILQLIVMAFTRSCVVILHVGDEGLVKQKEPTIDDIKKVFMPIFEKTSKNVVGILTGDKTSWTKSNSEQYLSRNLLATASETSIVNVTGCILMYAESAYVSMPGNVSVSLPMSPSTDGSKCGDTEATLQLSFKPTGKVTAVTLTFTFTLKAGAWSTQAVAKITGEDIPKDEMSLSARQMEAPDSYSWSCGNLTMLANSTDVISVVFVNFQVQPFKVNEKFSDSYDCVGWFTIPIWMGVFVSIIFIVIINIGVYALFSVHTMDRFDDPKGKTISVAASE